MPASFDLIMFYLFYQSCLLHFQTALSALVSGASINCFQLFAFENFHFLCYSARSMYKINSFKFSHPVTIPQTQSLIEKYY